VSYVIPKEGTDFYVDVMVVPAASEHSEAAHKFINFILKPENQLWVVENIFSKVPNKTSMEMVSQEMMDGYPNLAMSPAELTQYETFKDLGADVPAVSRLVTEIMSAR
jgi:spermidine/putrescine transport system substrate-binding protein